MYGCLAWRTRVELATCKDQLKKFQRMVCIATTGAMRTAPTDALQAMLDLPPLHMEIESEPRMATHRLMDCMEHCNVLKSHYGVF